mgnify:CR=1 FL=1
MIVPFFILFNEKSIIFSPTWWFMFKNYIYIVFSYFIFMTRREMSRYFKSVHQSLADDGVFFLDAFGGYEAAKELTEERECDGFTYIWDQASFNPINELPGRK